MQNIIVSNNQFYTQDEHLDGEPQRVIKPIHVDLSPHYIAKKSEKIIPSINEDLIAGAIVSENNFTNVHPYYEIPMATRMTGIIDMPGSPRDTYSFDFSKHIPWGSIKSYSVTMTVAPEEIPVPYSVVKVSDKTITVKTASPIMARFDITVDVNSSYTSTDNSVITQ